MSTPSTMSCSIMLHIELQILAILMHCWLPMQVNKVVKGNPTQNCSRHAYYPSEIDSCVKSLLCLMHGDTLVVMGLTHTVTS